MNDDLIKKAESLIESEQCEYEHCKLPEMIEELIAEIKCMREENDALKNQIRVIKIVAFNGPRDYEKIVIPDLKAQLAAKDAQIARLEKEANGHLHDFNRLVEQLNIKDVRIRELEQLAIQERARCLYNKAMYGTGYDLPNGINEFMDQAAKELALEAAQAALDKLRAGT